MKPLTAFIIAVAALIVGNIIYEFFILPNWDKQNQFKLSAEVQKTRAAEEKKKAEQARGQAEKERKEAALAEQRSLAERRKLEKEGAIRREEQERKEARRQEEATARFGKVAGGPPTNFLPLIQGRVVSFGFFTQWKNALPNPNHERNLINHFRRAVDTVIGWQLTINHPPLNMPVILPMKVVAYRDDGTVVYNGDVQHQIMAGWTTSWIKNVGTVATAEMGRDRYSVDLYHDGVKIAGNSFYVD